MVKTKLEKIFWKFDKKLEKLYHKHKEFDEITWEHRNNDGSYKTILVDKDNNQLILTYIPEDSK